MPVPITVTIVPKLQHVVLVKRESGVGAGVAYGSRHLIKNIGDARSPVDIPIRGLMQLLVKDIHLHIVLGSIGSAAIPHVIPNPTRDGIAQIRLRRRRGRLVRRLRIRKIGVDEGGLLRAPNQVMLSVPKTIRLCELHDSVRSAHREHIPRIFVALPFSGIALRDRVEVLQQEVRVIGIVEIGIHARRRGSAADFSAEIKVAAALISHVPSLRARRSPTSRARPLCGSCRYKNRPPRGRSHRW